jgi:hypothetical protein
LIPVLVFVLSTPLFKYKYSGYNDDIVYTNVYVLGDEIELDEKTIIEELNAFHNNPYDDEKDETYDFLKDTNYKVKFENNCIKEKDGKYIASKVGECEIYFQCKGFKRVIVKRVIITDKDYSDFTRINTVEEFLNIDYQRNSLGDPMKDDDGNRLISKYILNANLDFTNADISLINVYGVLINPYGYTLDNIHFSQDEISENNKLKYNITYEYSYNAMFIYVSGLIDGLIFNNFKYVVDRGGHDTFAVSPIQGYSAYISNVKMDLIINVSKERPVVVRLFDVYYAEHVVTKSTFTYKYIDKKPKFAPSNRYVNVTVIEK